MKIQIGEQNLEMKPCTTFSSRLLGMMFLKSPLPYGFYFPNCSSLHTFFMRQNIDIIMVNENQQIIAYYFNIKPWKIISNRKAKGCYEFSTGILHEVIVGQSIIVHK